VDAMADIFLESAKDKTEEKLSQMGLKHLHVAVRGKSIVIYSEFESNKENRCRFTNLSGATYELGMADHNGKWEATPFEGTVDELLEMVMTEFEWILCDFEHP
jgi:hypothetical protein